MDLNGYTVLKSTMDKGSYSKRNVQKKNWEVKLINRNVSF